MKRNILVSILLAALLLTCGCQHQTQPITIPEASTEYVATIAAPVLTPAVETEQRTTETQTEPILTEPKALIEPKTVETEAPTEPIKATVEPHEEDKPESAERQKTAQPAAASDKNGAKQTTQPKEADSPKETTAPKQTEPPVTGEAPAEQPEAPAESQNQPTVQDHPAQQPEAPVASEAPTEPVEIPNEPQKEALDFAALEAYGNQYAASLGFTIDYSMTTGNSGYFPPDGWIWTSMEDGKRCIREVVAGTKEWLIDFATYTYGDDYPGWEESGVRGRVILSVNNDGWNMVTVLYG